MKNRMKISLVILIVAVILILIWVYKPCCLKEIEETKVCETDSDCVKVTTSCCPCSMGGDELCVPANNASLYTPTDCPEELGCATLYNCKIERCICVYGECGPVLETENISIIPGII